jgi:hypothetical protein
MTDAEYVGREFRKALKDRDGGPVETVRVKAEGPTGSSRWVTVSVGTWERMIAAGVAAIGKSE